MRRLITIVTLLTVLVVLLSLNANPVVRAQTSTLSSSTTPLPVSDTTMLAPRAAIWQAGTEPGETCKFINFEGIGNLSPVPVFDGIASPDWLGIIDADAGGTGNIAFEPSPNTIAFWLGGDPSARDLEFQNPASRVSFRYASAVTISMTAYDEDGNVIQSVTGAANYGAGPGGDPNGEYNKWDPLTVTSTANDIVRVRVSGDANYTGIDDLSVCQKIGIEQVEFTQAIQQLQTLEALKADLEDDGQPPVPIVARKPLALRVYPKTVDTTTPFTVELSGEAVGDQTVTLQPNCDTDKYRRQQSGCQSLDFYFTPPSGMWDITLTVKDGNGDEVESHSFEVESVTAEPLVMGAVQVCDAKDSNGAWLCASNYYSRLSQLVALMRQIAPTDRVTVEDTGETVRIDTATYDSDGDGILSNDEMELWWGDIASDIDGFYGFFDGIRDLLGLEDRRYMGITRDALAGNIAGIADDIPSRGAASRSSSQDLGVDISQDTVAHETFHTMGRLHTNTGAPAASVAPGCNFASQPGTDWPYPDNRIQSDIALEVGFNVALRQALDPETNFDVMSYCAPVWISPFTYVHLLEDALTRSSRSSAQPQMGNGDFWVLSGRIAGTSTDFEPLLTLNTNGPTEPLTGTHRIEVRSATNTLLFTRFLTPATAHTRVIGGGSEYEGDSYFNELIPVQSGATRLVLIGSDDTTLGSITLSGTPPVINIAFPAGGESLSGTQTLRWTGSGTLNYWVQYSPNNGAVGSWHTLASNLTATTLTVNFDSLPGATANGRIRVVGTNGTNSTSLLSNPFTVTLKQPTVDILYPGASGFVKGSDMVWLQATAFDPDDGLLDETSVQWVSNRDGNLGNGVSRPVTFLSEGTHTITVTATDSHGNQTTDSVNVTVDTAAPQMTLTVTPDGTPASCVNVTITGSDNPGGSGLSSITYSLNGGQSWQGYSFPFTVPGTGYFHLIAKATDRAGNSVVADQRFFIETPCTTVIQSLYLPLIRRQ